MKRIQIKRLYESPQASDGYRILVDRVWPRGKLREELRIDAWLRELGPSDALRMWFNHEPSRFPEFEVKYREELRTKTDLLDSIREQASKGQVTLLYGARDREHNQAVVLLKLLMES